MTQRVIIIGAGFGGLFAARQFRDARDIEVMLIDRNNYHTFTPLIYQVATCALEPNDVAYPVRSIFRDVPHVNFLMGEVTALDYETQHITVDTPDGTRREDYDYLIISAGNTPTYFGNDEFKPYAHQVNTLDDALALRNHILRCFEMAAWSDDPDKCDALTTIVVVGGGPTGLETAGAVYELYNNVLNREFQGSNLKARVVLVEMLPHVLAPYPEKLRASALEQLRSLGVEVRLESQVTEAHDDHVVLKDGTTIPAYTLVWTAGVQGNAIGESLDDSEITRGKRVPVHPTMQVIGYDRVYVAGDMSYLEDPEGNPYPQLIPVAQQQGRLAAQNIMRRIDGKTEQPFTYNDRGSMATIGRSRAVAWLYNRIALSGFVAWIAWLGLHLLTLLGFRNRISVFLNWVWNYIAYDRTVRIISRHIE